MMYYLKKGTRLSESKTKLNIFLKRYEKQILILLYSSILTSFILFLSTDIFFFILVPVPLIIFIFYTKSLNKLKVGVKLLLTLLFTLILLFVFSLITQLISFKTNFVILNVIFFSLIFMALSYLIFILNLILIKKPVLYFIFNTIIIFLLSVLIHSILLQIIFIVFLIFITSLTYFLAIKPDNFTLKNLLYLLIVLILIGFFTFLISQLFKSDSGQNLLKESFFKYQFNDRVTLKSDYNFQGSLLFFAKLGDSMLLKAVSYPYFNREKGFYMTDIRDLPFPAILTDFIWEDKGYIKGGDRKEEDVTIYNVNLSEGTVFAPNEPYRIVPYQKIPESKFTSVFSAYSLSTQKIEEKLWQIDISWDSLSPEEYKKYTDVGKKDDEILDFISQYKEYFQSNTDLITFFYYYFKQNYYYSITTNQEDGYAGLKSFIFKTKKGYCAHFASAYALILRYLGVPARVVGGFKAMEDNKIMDYYRFYDFNAHSWVEIYTDAYGWIPIDPTSDRLAEDEVLPFQKPSSEDESSYLEDIINIEKKLKPVEKEEDKNKFQNKLENSLKDLLFKYKKPIILSVFIIVSLLILYLVFRFRIMVLYSYYNKRYLKKMIKVYMKKLSKIVKKEYLTAEELFSYIKEATLDDKSREELDFFIDIYNNLTFAPESLRNERLSIENSKKAYKAFVSIKKKMQQSKVQQSKI